MVVGFSPIAFLEYSLIHTCKLNVKIHTNIFDGYFVKKNSTFINSLMFVVYTGKASIAPELALLTAGLRVQLNKNVVFVVDYVPF